MKPSLQDLLKTRRLLHACRVLGFAGLLGSSCSTAPKTDEAPQGTEEAAATPKISMAEWSLLEMTFDEAKAITPQNAEVGSLFRVAADTVEVLKTDDAGKPVKVRAKGHVFLEMPLADRATALCDEASITLTEAVLYGGPMMMQNSRVAKSTSESTTFRVTDYLKVSGRFEMLKPEDLMQTLLAPAESVPPPMKTAATQVKLPKSESPAH